MNLALVSQSACKSTSKLTSLARLRLAAQKLFVEKGYDETRPQDIAREAGLANGTFYLHFNDKKDAFLDFAGEAQKRLISQFRSELEGVEGREKRWRVIFAVMEDYANRHPGVLEVAFLDPVFIAPHDEDAWQLYDRMGQFIFKSMNENIHSADYDLELVSHAICGMMRHAMIYCARKGVNKEKMVSDLIKLIDKGMYGQGLSDSHPEDLL